MALGTGAGAVVVVAQTVINQKQLAPIRFLRVLAGRIGEQGAHLFRICFQTGGEYG